MIGIRREDKSHWEARTPLVPGDVGRLTAEEGISICVERSEHRAFDERAYQKAGAEIVNDLKGLPIVMGVKEIPVEKLEAETTYLYFSHTIKGQPGNMPALRRILELGSTLIDYERIVDERNRRLVFFGRFAGLAGMIDTLWILGRRFDYEGVPSPFSVMKPAHQYRDLDDVRAQFSKVAAAIRTGGLPPEIQPFVVGVAGYGQVSQGAQEILELLPFEKVHAADLPELKPRADIGYSVVFRESDMVVPASPDRVFDLQRYYDHPEEFQPAFFPHVRHLTVLVNAIYWEPRYPRFITREQFAELYGRRPRLRVVGDITCDINGSLACTTRATDPDSPVYVYDPVTGGTTDGVSGNGPVVLAVDFLPCELPVDASRNFSHSLSPFIPGLAQADLSRPLKEAGLPPELERATIVYRGELTNAYRYLESSV